MQGYSQVTKTLMSDLKSFGVKISKTTDIFLSFGLIDPDDEVELKYMFLAIIFGKYYSTIRKIQTMKDRS